MEDCRQPYIVVIVVTCPMHVIIQSFFRLLELELCEKCVFPSSNSLLPSLRTLLMIEPAVADND